MRNYYFIFYSFIIYSFLGWIMEEVYHFIKHKTIVNRGFLIGPLCPIYGTGAVLAIILLVPYGNNVLYVFIGGFIIGSVVELITGSVLEKLLDTRWWDYSDEKYNFKGYICLKFSIIWGFIAIFFVEVLNKFISSVTYSIAPKLGDLFYNIVLIVLIVDITLTISNLIGLRNLINELEEVLAESKAGLEKLKLKALNIENETVLKLRLQHLDKIKEILNRKISFRNMRMLQAYPRASSKKFGEALEEVKSRIGKTLKR